MDHRQDRERTGADGRRPPPCSIASRGTPIENPEVHMDTSAVPGPGRTVVASHAGAHESGGYEATAKRKLLGGLGEVHPMRRLKGLRVQGGGARRMSSVPWEEALEVHTGTPSTRSERCIWVCSRYSCLDPHRLKGLRTTDEGYPELAPRTACLAEKLWDCEGAVLDRRCSCCMVALDRPRSTPKSITRGGVDGDLERCLVEATIIGGLRTPTSQQRPPHLGQEKAGRCGTKKRRRSRRRVSMARCPAIFRLMEQAGAYVCDGSGRTAAARRLSRSARRVGRRLYRGCHTPNARRGSCRRNQLTTPFSMEFIAHGEQHRPSR